MTNAEFQTILSGCNFRQPEVVADLISQRYTSQKINEKVMERHMGSGDGYGYFANFFPVKTWQDGQGQSELREMYFAPRVPYSFNYFTRTMQVTDPNNANECHTDYCEVPEGGYGNLPQLEMYKWGFKTKRHCIANIRHIRDFMIWSKRILDTRHYIDQEVMKMFYMLAAIRTSGHKILLEAQRNATTGLLEPFTSTSPRNPLGGFKHSYMEPLFPAVHDPSNIVPLSIDILDQLARRWTLFGNNNNVGVGPRGEKIFEFWYPEDWYKQEVIDNPDLIEKLKYWMPSKMFAGYSLDPGQREVLGNWQMRVMPSLPRFTESCNGGLVPVDMHVDVAVEIGDEAVESVAYQNAPILMFCSPSPNQGSILMRPDLNTDATGMPIMPIMGNGDWMIRNDYDAECNEDLNQPYSQKRYEMGFQLEDPNAAVSGLFRAKRYRIRAINECDLQPIFTIQPPDVCPGGTIIGCADNTRKHQSEITTTDLSKYILVSSVTCGPAEYNGESNYRLQVEWKGNRPGFNMLDCDCGSNVHLFIYDENGDYLRQQDGLVVEMLPHNISPTPLLWVQTVTLADNECIKGVTCIDDARVSSTVNALWDTASRPDCDAFDGLLFLLDIPLDCADGDSVTISTFDAVGAAIDVITGTITTANPQTQIYQIESVDGGFTKALLDAAASITIACD